MSNELTNSFEIFLQSFDESDWQAAVEAHAPAIHEVDRNAVRIWFRFYPLSLQRYLTNAADPDEAKQGLAMQGDYGLADRINTSHSFLYGHRYWGLVRTAVLGRSEDSSAGIGLSEEIAKIAAAVSQEAGVDKSLTLGISAVGLMTLNQVGLAAFAAATASTSKPEGLMTKSPDAIVEARKRDDSQGIFGFLKTVDKKFSVIHNEPAGLRFEIMNDQEIASASANDRSQNWQARDPRCWEGPVPVECTSASCGTCWVGVIAGEEKLSDVARRERRAVKVFGYNETESDKPLIRLACQQKHTAT